MTRLRRVIGLLVVVEEDKTMFSERTYFGKHSFFPGSDTDGIRTAIM